MRTLWTEAQIASLREHFPHRKTRDVAALIGRPEKSVSSKANELGLRKTAEYLASPDACRLTGQQGCTTRFTSGQRSWNKGTSYQPGGRAKETQFKPGRRPEDARNYQPIGSERITRDGILERKVTDDPTLLPARRWVAVARLVWEAAHGPIAPGLVCVFKPGRKTTVASEITADALELVTRVELMARNTLHRYPEPIPQLIQLRGALQRQINKRTRNEEQD